MTTQQRRDLVSTMAFLNTKKNGIDYPILATLTDEEIQTEFVLKYNFKYVYMICTGEDYDGCNRFMCDKYPTYLSAVPMLESHCEGSDGLMYSMVDEAEARDYVANNDRYWNSSVYHVNDVEVL
jgi:predicted HD phosphohydrolase